MILPAILFDLDGVLMETEHETFRFYQEYLKQRGVTLTDDRFRFKAGRKSRDFFREAFSDDERRRVDLEQMLREKRDRFNSDPGRYIKKMPGAREVLITLTNVGHPLALASQNERRMIDTVMNWMNIRSYFRTILSLDDITKKKPDPEIYFLAAARLRLSPDQCVVIEDSFDGVQSAKAAGMYCIGVFHDYMPERTLASADEVIRALAEIPRIVDRLGSQLKKKS